MIILIFSMAAPFAQIRSVRSRALSSEPNVVTHKYANMSPATFLANRLLSVTIVNGTGDADIKIEFSITIDDYSGTNTDWDGEMSIDLLATLPSGETLTLDNTTITEKENLDRLMDFGFENFSSAFGDPENPSTNPGGITIDGSDIDVTQFLDLLTLPEGIYSMVFKIYEKVSDDWTLKGSSTELEFKVANIGDLSIESYPAIGSAAASWKLPMVPGYNTDDYSSYKTYSVVSITGKDVNYNKTFTHANPGGAELKGYPGGTGTEGLYELDLSSLNLPFRMGESYTLEVAFKDWNNAKIADTKTFVFDYDAESISYDEPSSGSTVSLLTPFLDWNFGIYEDNGWVDSYSLFINNTRVATGLTDSEYTFENPLSFGTNYEWYVIPFYESDGAAFFTSGTVGKSSFSTIAHEAPSLDISGLADSDMLLVDQAYELSADVTANDDMSIADDDIVWKIGSATLTGPTVEFTPSQRYANNSLQIECTVTDSSGAASTSSFRVTVLDPVLAITGSESVTANQPYTYETGGGTQDVGDISWSLSGPESSSASGPDASFTFTSLGDYELSAETEVSDSLGNTVTVSSNILTISSESAGPPTVSITGPAAMSLYLVDNPLTFSAAITSPNTISETIWSYESNESSESGASESFTFTPSADLLSNGDPTTITVSCTVTDEFGGQASAQRNIVLIDPAVEFSTITDGTRLPLNSSLSISVTADYAESVSWFVDGEEKSGLRYTFTTSGDHTLQAKAVWEVSDGSGGTTSYEKETDVYTIYVVDSTPPDVEITLPTGDIPLLAGDDYTYNLKGSASADSGIDEYRWSVDGQELFGEEISVSFAENGASRTEKITLHAVNGDGVEGSAEIFVTVLNPSVVIQRPNTNSFPVNTAIPLYGTSSEGTLFWDINGEQYDAVSWNRKIAEPGEYTIAAGWRVEASDSDGGTDTFEKLTDETFSFSVYSTAAPTVTAASPEYTLLKQRVNEPLNFSFAASSENGDVETSWSVLPGTPGAGAGESFTFSGWSAPGVYTVTASAADPMGISTSRSWTVKIINPTIAISSVRDGGIYGSGSFPVPAAATQNILSVTYSYDAGDGPAEAADGYDWKNLPIGDYTIGATGTYSIIDENGPTEMTINAAAIACSVVNLTPPTLTLSGIASGDLLLAGEEYTVAAEASGARGTDISSVEWFLNGASIGEGESVSFNAGNERTVKTLRSVATDSSGLQTIKEIRFKVIDPRIEIVLPTIAGNTGVYPDNTNITMQYAGQDISEVIWIIGGREYAANRFTLSAGSYTVPVGAKGYAYARKPDGSLGKQEVSAEEKTIEVIGAPVITSAVIDSDKIIKGSDAVVTTEFNGTIKKIDLLLNGSAWASASEPSGSFAAAKAVNAVGDHTILIKVTDIFGRADASELKLSVYPPISLSIESPAGGKVYGPNERISLEGKLLDARSASLIDHYAWKIGGKEVLTTLMGTIPAQDAGTHTLTLSAVDIFGNEVTAAESEFSVQADLIMSLIAPSYDVSIVEGSSYTCRVSARPLSDKVKIEELTDNITWEVNGSEVGSGLSYQFTPDNAGEFTIQARYSEGSVQRETKTVTITVREFAVPAISSPDLSSVIFYGSGEKLQFTGTGFSDAAFIWMLDGKVIGRAKSFTYDPKGLQGSYKLQLITEYNGLSKMTERMINLKINTPPAITLTAAPVQFAGNALAYQVSVLDIEDGVITPTVLLDGQALSQEERILTVEDSGRHELRVIAADSKGAAVQEQLVFTVEEGVTGINLISPKAGAETIIERGMQFLASLTGESSTAAPQEITWEIKYLDAAEDPVELTGANPRFTPQGVGEVLVTARYADSASNQNFSSQAVFNVVPEPVNLAIYWPHGEMVNGGAPLSPELVGLTDGGQAEWLIDGVAVPGQLTAPAAGGAHTLAVRVTKGSEVIGQDQMVFSVNAAPTIRITAPVAGAQVVTGLPVVFTAAAEDDGGNPAIVWTDSAGNELGSGATLIKEGLTAGEYTYSAVASDQYGAESDPAAVGFTLYDPIMITSAAVNGGIGTYLLNGQPIRVDSVITGGIAPSVTWSLIQGGNTVESAGNSGNLAATGNGFTAGSAVVRMSVSDRGAVQKVKDFPLQLIDEASLVITTPAADAPLWAADTQTIDLTVVGLNNPVITATIGGSSAAVTSTVVSESGNQKILRAVVDTSTANSEGVYQLQLAAASNGLNLTADYTMNIFEREPGIEIAGVPAQYDTELMPSVPVTAQAVGLGGGIVLEWYTSTATEPVGTGESIDLNAVTLVPGTERILVMARDEAGNTAAQDSVEFTVLGPLTLNVTPADELVSVFQNSDFKMTAAAADRDGTALEGDSIRWISHLDGEAATGTEFAPGMTSLQPGEHILTVSAIGAEGGEVQHITKLLVRESDVPAPTTQPTTDEQEEEKNTEFSGGTGMVIEPEVLGTVLSVTGNVQVTKALDGETEDVDVNTLFYEGDTVEIKGNGTLMVFINETGESVMLDKGEYTWNSKEPQETSSLPTFNSTVKYGGIPDTGGGHSITYAAAGFNFDPSNGTNG